MPRPRKGPRLYTREQGGQLRYYADLRSVGRGRVALIPEGDTQATTDPVIAAKMLANLLESVQEQRRDGALLGVKRRASLEEYASEHLVKKAKSGRVGEHRLTVSEHYLSTAIAFFGGDRDLASIGVEDVQRFAHHLAELSNGRGGTISSSTQRKYLVALSNLFRRAQGEGILRGVNPVSALMDKPLDERAEAPWLEVWEGALLLEAARIYPYDRADVGTPGNRLRAAIAEALWDGPGAEEIFVQRMREAGKLTTPERLAAYLAGERQPTKGFLLTAARVLDLPEDRLYRPRGWNTSRQGPPALLYPLLATFLLTGGREAEVLGLELGDVSLRRGKVAFRPNQWRGLKTQTSRRAVPLWPQLREILDSYLEERRAAGGGEHDLLFPSPRTGERITDLRKSLDVVASRVGWQAGEIRTKAFRHAYCSARLQTLDRGHPVSERTVAGEMGHGGYELVRRVYGHLGEIRHRSEVVEYCLEQQREAIPPERLSMLLRVS